MIKSIIYLFSYKITNYPSKTTSVRKRKSMFYLNFQSVFIIFAEYI